MTVRILFPTVRRNFATQESLASARKVCPNRAREDWRRQRCQGIDKATNYACDCIPLACAAPW